MTMDEATVITTLSPTTEHEHMVKDGMIYCPMCRDRFAASPYLMTIFSVNKPLWLANMVTHYRHVHIKYYDKWVRYMSWKYNYSDFKYIVNERAKRQILRRCKDHMKAHGVTIQDLLALQGRDQKTIELYAKVLGGSIKDIDFTQPPQESDKVPESLEEDPTSYFQSTLKVFK